MAVNRFHKLREHFADALSNFQSSNLQIRILSAQPSPLTKTKDVQHSPASLPSSMSKSSSNLIILDSSFNPPTVAHAAMLRSAVDATPQSTSTRILLLLSVSNADKEPAPALFPTRLCMMHAFAEDMLSEVQSQGVVGIDLGVTRLPYFHDKSIAIDSVEEYSGENGETDMHQIFLAGFDTLIRIFNPKYYPGGLSSALQPFFERARLRITMREDDEWGGKEEQVDYLKKMKDGKLESLGGHQTWIGKIDMVEGRREGKGVSSSQVRRMVTNRQEVKGLVTERVQKVIEEENL